MYFWRLTNDLDSELTKKIEMLLFTFQHYAEIGPASIELQLWLSADMPCISLKPFE